MPQRRRARHAPSSPPRVLACQPLLPGLPDDLALLCLARLPRAKLFTLRGVSKPWRLALSAPTLQDLRAQLNVAEPWLYIETRDRDSCGTSWVAFDVQEAKWRRVPPVPRPKRYFPAEIYGRASAVVSGHLVVAGGRAGLSGPTLRDVFAYSPLANKWTRRRSMQHSRSCPHAWVLDGKLCVLGGSNDRHPYKQPPVADAKSGAPCTSECYNFELDEWQAVSLQVSQANLHGDYVDHHGMFHYKLYDPVAGNWKLIPAGGKWKTIPRTHFAIDFANEQIVKFSFHGDGPLPSPLYRNERFSILGLGSTLYVEEETPNIGLALQAAMTTFEVVTFEIVAA